MVLLRPLGDMQQSDTFKVFDTETPEYRQHLIGEVVSITDRLVYHGYDTQYMTHGGSVQRDRRVSLVEKSLQWNTRIEVKVGDRVYFRFVHLLNSRDDKDAWIEIDGEKYLMLRYDELLARIDGNELYPLNGYVLVEPSIKEPPAYLTTKKRTNTEGVIVAIGKRNKHYIERPNIVSLTDLKVGDRVYYSKYAAIRLETEGLRQFGNQTALDRIQGRDIKAILNS